MRDFEYFEPVSIREAISLLSEHKGKAKIIAGGTDLIPQMQERKIMPEYVVNIGHIPGLNYIREDTEGVKIGPLTTIRSIEKSAEIQERYQILFQSACQIASMSIRNIATIGGNLCNASPAADMAPPLIVLSAKVKIAGPSDGKVVPLEDFFIGPNTTILKPDELLVEIQVPPLDPRSGAVFLKHGRRGASEVATVGVAVIITLEPKDGICKDIRIALGSVAPIPMRALKAEGLLKGKQISDDILDEVAHTASSEANPISDVHAPAQYRKEMVTVFTRRAMKAAFELASRR